MRKQISNELRETFNNEFQQYISDAVARGYQRLAALSAGIDFLESKPGEDAKPYLRKAIIDNNLYKLGQLIRNMKSSYETNEGNNCWHVELRIGRFIVTHNFVRDFNEHPRDCEFRKNLQFINIQLSFKEDKERNIFLIDREILEDQNEPIYAQIIHGGKGIKPNFIHLCVPNHDATEWIDRLVLPIFTFSEVPIEDIPDKATPARKKQKKTGNEPDEK